MINQFNGKFRFLSNFWPITVHFEGIFYPSTEHAYQASKTSDIDLRQKIARIPKPGLVKNLMRQYPRNPKADSIMEDLNRQKFSSYPLRQWMIDTRPEELIEGNYWHDNYWGQCRCFRCVLNPAHNKFGKILMQIRDTL